MDRRHIRQGPLRLGCFQIADGDARAAQTNSGDNAFEIVRILVVGVETEGGIRPVRPAAYFSLFGVKEYAV